MFTLRQSSLQPYSFNLFAIRPIDAYMMPGAVLNGGGIGGTAPSHRYSPQWPANEIFVKCNWTPGIKI